MGSQKQFKRNDSDVKKVFKCEGFEGCTMAFNRAEHLSRHVRKHTGEKPFQCYICLRYFSRVDNLKQHRDSVHANVCYPSSYFQKPLTNMEQQMVYNSFDPGFIKFMHTDTKDTATTTFNTIQLSSIQQYNGIHNHGDILIPTISNYPNYNNNNNYNYNHTVPPFANRYIMNNPTTTISAYPIKHETTTNESENSSIVSSKRTPSNDAHKKQNNSDKSKNRLSLDYIIL